MLSSAVDFIFPEDLQCPICEDYRLLTRFGMCQDCLKKLENQSLERSLEGVDTLFSCFVYNEVAKGLIERHKRGHQRYLSKLFAKMCAENLKSADIYIDRITWVPTSTVKQWMRGCDHARDIAEEFASLTGVPVDSLLKKRFGKGDQKHLSREARFDNMAEAFVCDREVSVGERILLVDDVMTTGATMQSAARALRTANPSVTIYGMTVFCGR